MNTEIDVTDISNVSVDTSLRVRSITIDDLTLSMRQKDFELLLNAMENEKYGETFEGKKCKANELLESQF